MRLMRLLQQGQKRRSQKESGSCGRIRRVGSAPWDAPLLCLMQPCSHLLSSAVAHGMSNCTLPRVLLGLCSHNVPWAVACPGAPWVCTRTICAHHPCLICNNPDEYQAYELLSFVVLQSRWEAGEFRDDACPLQRIMFMGQLICC